MKFPKPIKQKKTAKISRATKRKPLRKKGGSPYKKAKAKAWKEFSTYIRVRDSIKTTGTKESCRCYTCQNIRPTFGVGCIQAGHFIGGRANVLLFDENQVHGQCYVCNYVRKGNWAEYYKKMVSEFGLDVVTNMIEGKYDVIEFSVADLEDIARIYKDKVSKL